MSCRATYTKACRGPSTQGSGQVQFSRRVISANRLVGHAACAVLLAGLLELTVASVRGEAMLELFQLTWPQVTQKMPEIAEAGYDSIWLPNPAKGNSGGFSIGYDQFDPFDLGSTNQQGTIATLYGTAGPTDSDGSDGASLWHSRLFRQHHESPGRHRARLSRLRHADKLLSRPDRPGLSSASRLRRI